jgi:hypothetical protein
VTQRYAHLSDDELTMVLRDLRKPRLWFVADWYKPNKRTRDITGSCNNTEYNHHVFWTIIFAFVILLIFDFTTWVGGRWCSSLSAHAANVSRNDLILAMNTLRMSYGLPALTEDPINAIAGQQKRWQQARCHRI